MHQSMTKKDVIDYIAGRHDGTLVAHDLKVTHRGSPNQDWVDEVDIALDDLLAAWKANDLSKLTSDQARDELEGVLSADLHQKLRRLPASVLTDRDFWRFCSAYLFDFVLWRQPAQTLTSLCPYFGVASEALGTECVPHRMFDRALIARAGDSAGADPYAMAKFGAADVWKSHILRTRNSYAPVFVHELLLDVSQGKLPTDPIRVLAKNLKRVRSNVLFEVLDELQARDLLDRERARVLGAKAGALDSDGPAS